LFRLDTDDPAARVQLVASEAGDLPDRRIFALHQDARGQHWIGTWQGVYPFDARSGRVGAALAPGAHLRLTWDIADAGNGGLWIGSSDGLVHVARDGRWRRYTERDGLANRVIYSIEVDRDGRLWLSTNRGVVRFDPRNRHTVNFGLQDQLQHTEFLFGAHAQDSDGRLLFGGPAGFNRIDPAKVANSGQVPRPVLTGIRIDHKEIEPGERIALAVPTLDRLVLGPDDGVVELHYGAIAHDQPREMRFRYRLLGYDRDWQEAGERRFATYTNLPPGQFVFEVEAIGRFGQRSAAPRRLQVEALPWWWETSAFRAAMVLLLLGLLAAVVRWRLADLSRQREALRLQVAERTAQIGQQRDELKRANAELDKLSRLDTLTGLANRRALLDILGGAVASASEQRTSLAVALVDLDHFKRINDSRGHAVGDLALRHFAQLWRPGLPVGAAFGRYGGEEFLLVLPGHDVAGATAVLDGLLNRLRTVAVPDVEPALRLSASAGVAVLAPHEGIDGLIHRADEALYQAKAGGRDRCAIAN
jgi:diguanylate cyclase (GGDEF)-like protein